MPQPADAVRDGILKGMYSLTPERRDASQVDLLGAGAILPEVIAAARLLEDDWGVVAQVWSVTSFTELQRDAIAVERSNRLNDQHVLSYVGTALAGSSGPVIAATDYVRAVPELIRACVPGRYVTLGTDGFGRSDTRQALRAFFEVDRYSVVVAALRALADDGKLPPDTVRAARERYGKAAGKAAAWLV
ncbi:Pyruvate dehydrogenase E1 component [compost metagenome]